MDNLPFFIATIAAKSETSSLFCNVCGKGNMRDLSVVGYVKLDSFARLLVAQFDEEEVD